MACSGVNFTLKLYTKPHCRRWGILVPIFFNSEVAFHLYGKVNTHKVSILEGDNKKAVFEHVVDNPTVIKCTNLPPSERVYGFICSDRTQKLTTTKR
jgi:hypothetical protein